MAFDQQTRNRLARFVGDCRTLLAEEFTRQLQSIYGIDPKSGDVADLETLTLASNQFETARLLRDTMEHYLASADTATASKAKKARIEVLDRIVREQAFTVLNRLCALRMAEARELLVESIGKGYKSKGFQLYKQLAGTALGETGDAYRCFLFSVFDEFAIDLPVLFDRFSPEGRLFPRETALLEVLDQINHAEIDALWAEDETIGWIYQYFNSVDERKEMRKHSAPRNSRELAVRNQFFTPRYVVEFLTDNTLGRIWYEMTQGQSSLKDSCRYLIRRPDEVFLGSNSEPETENAIKWLHGEEAYIPTPDDLSVCSSAYERSGNSPESADEWARPFSKRSIDDWYSQSTQELVDYLYAHLRMRQPGDIPSHENALLVEIRDEIKTRCHKVFKPNLPQEELLNAPVLISYRRLKDPRDIKMLDPACGSMHFGLYAFDLFERIYDEAWELESSRGTEAFRRSDDLKPLRETYDNKATFHRDVPRLIIERNIHGIDIDPRAVQIASLSLWLRAQKRWYAMRLEPQNRPQIQRSNIVCAEPMPGQADMREEFVDKLQPKVLGQLVRIIFDQMKWAGEAGTLLSIENEIQGAVASAHKEYQEFILQKKKEKGFLPGMSPQQDTTLFDFADLPKEDDFWNRAEAMVLAALRGFAERAQGSDTSRRRMFADDSARGFSFIDVCRRRYDAVLMNPPFGEFGSNTKKVLQSQYSESKNDIYTSFIQRGLQIMSPRGIVGAITSRTWLTLSSFARWRSYLLANSFPILIADLGRDVLDDANVQVCAYCLEKCK